ncbi:PfkB family carbohydrate kinase, partial [Streptomyces sp. NPDC058525]|uniref:PfkB family carbohydrate kinase n=1 Tax=Streptomyces sp. NPDC058525 TaxID=3346538 RepID=UPI00366A4479
LIELSEFVKAFEEKFDVTAAAAVAVAGPAGAAAPAEAEALWGTDGGTESVRRLLPEPEVLVVKQGADGATVFARPAPGGPDTAVHEPAPTVDVVASVGAGDAFAAGYLSAELRGLSIPERIRHGHLAAASVLTSAEDLAPPPPRELADRLAALDARTWRELHLTAGWSVRRPATPGADTSAARPGGGGRAAHS